MPDIYSAAKEGLKEPAGIMEENCDKAGNVNP